MTGFQNVSIVILSYNTKEITHTAVLRAHDSAKYYSQKSKAKTEIIVVDNASTDGTVELLKKSKLPIRLSVLKKNSGVSVGYNHGMKMSKYPLILLLNNDTYLNETTLLDSVNWFSKHPKADVVIGRLKDRNDKFGPYGGYLPTPGRTIRLFVGLDFLPLLGSKFKRIYNFGKIYQHDQELEWIPTCFFFLRRQVYTKTGGHDEKIFFYMDDIEWCQRINSAGFHIWTTPKITCVHLGGQSTPPVNGFRILLERQVAGMLYFHRKFYPRTETLVKLFIWLGIRFRSLFYLLKLDLGKSLAYLTVRI